MVDKEFPEASIIRNEANFGFAKANNLALKQIESRYALLLNPDMLLKPDTLGDMVGWMEKNQQAVVASCRLLDEKGEIVRHVRRFPELWDQLAIALKLPHLVPGILDKYLRPGFDDGQAAPVDSVRGAFFLINLEVARELKLFADSTLPYLDERYFLWFEEVDYCRQVRKGGGEVWYTPAAEGVDLVGQSFKQVRRQTTQKYFAASMLEYFRKWHPAWQGLLLKIAWLVGKILAKISDKIGIKGRART